MSENDFLHSGSRWEPPRSGQQPAAPDDEPEMVLPPYGYGDPGYAAAAASVSGSAGTPTGAGRARRPRRGLLALAGAGLLALGAIGGVAIHAATRGDYGGAANPAVFRDHPGGSGTGEDGFTGRVPGNGHERDRLGDDGGLRLGRADGGDDGESSGGGA